MTPSGFDELELESYEYDGPIAHAGGGDSGSSDQTSKPWKKIQPQVLEAAGNLSTAANQPNEYYGGETVAGFTPWQTQGMQGMADYAMSPEMGGMIGNQQNAVNFGMSGGFVNPNTNSALGMSGDMYGQFSNYGNDPALQNSMGIAGQANQAVADPYSDPTIAPWIAAATRPITQNYQENVLPGIRDQAEMYGGAGSRTGLAEGVAARGYMDAVGATSANVYNQAYGTNVNRQMQAGGQLASAYGQTTGNQMMSAGMYGQNYGQGMTAGNQMVSMAPGAMSAGMMPWQTLQGVGGQEQALNQANLTSDQMAYDYNRDADFNRSTQYFSTMMGTPWGETEASGGSSGPSAIEGAAGGAMIGGALAGAQAGGVTGPWGAAIGAGVGAAYSIWG